MREILFRGQDAATGDWIKGFYVHLFDDKGNESHRIYSGYAETDCEDYYPEFWEVDPETVGQFTGLTDKNGKKIFEGDIIRSDNGKVSAVSVVKYGNFRPKMIYDMFWNYTGHFPRQNLHGVYCESNKQVMMLFDSPTCIEVIGNFHDNPELLEGGSEIDFDYEAEDV